jgi:oligopeptidase B
VKFGTSLLLALSIGCATTTTLKPPVAKRVPHEITVHGDRLVDDYYWFRDRENPELERYLDAEEAYTSEVMKPTAALQETLYREMASRIDETDASVPYRKGQFLYYTRYEPGRQYPIYARKRALEAPEEILLDLNELAAAQPYMSVNAFEISDDGNLLAFSTDNSGYRQYVLQIKDLRTGRLLPDRIEKTRSVAWAADNRTLFYVTEDGAKRPDRFWRHRLGQTADDLVFDEKDVTYRIGAWRSRSGDYIFLTSGSKIADEVRYVRADKPDDAFRVITPRRPGHEYSVDHSGSNFYIVTNDKGKNSRLVAAPVAAPDERNWTEIVPHNPSRRISEAEAFAKHVVVTEREEGLTQLRIIGLESNDQHRVSWPEPVYAVSTSDNATFDTQGVRVRYQSFVTPVSTFEYDMGARTLTRLDQARVPGYDASRYTSERVMATARDGSKIPISLVYRRDINPRGRNPLLLYAYGAYGSVQGTTFASDRLSLLDRGVIYALAHIRGGGEMGEQWHEQGRMMAKKNTFTDFIDSADYLISQGYTSREKIAAMGLSAGGLLMGAVTNMRPDLFRAVVAKVPFVDVVNTMLDASIPLTASEWLEWGDPRIENEYRYLRSYDPYNNIGKGPYPDMLVRISMNDSQVPYWEGAKYVARRRAMATDDSLLLLKVNKAAGHSGASGRYDRLREQAFDYAFILTRIAQ